jgi:hypothetical protein
MMLPKVKRLHVMPSQALNEGTDFTRKESQAQMMQGKRINVAGKTFDSSIGIAEGRGI